MIVDVVTQRNANLHDALLDLLGIAADAPGRNAFDLYAAAYRSVDRTDGLALELWLEALALGGSLPTLPLWIGRTEPLPLDLEQTYQSACSARRID